MNASNPTPRLPPDLFEATRWSMVVEAADSGLGPASHRALSELCQTYWFPVYVYLRRKGYDNANAEDLTQGFFAHLLEKKRYAHANPERGRFRAFLMTALKHFVLNAYQREQALKRGGGARLVELDAGKGEARYALVSDKALDPSCVFDREWAETVVRTTLERLHAEYAETGREPLFNHLRHCIVSPGQQGSQAELAHALGTTEAAVKAALQRLRKRFRWLLRHEIAQTTATPDDVDDEIRYLLDCLRTAPGH